MSKSKPTPGGRAQKNTAVSLVRSSAAEYLTFVAAGGNSGASIEMRYEDENIWLTQKMMAALYDVSIPAINQHLKRIFSDNELVESAVIKQYLTTAAAGKSYQTKHYSLQAIIAVGFKIENTRAVQFRKWANQIVKDYTIQGWTMDADPTRTADGFKEFVRIPESVAGAVREKSSLPFVSEPEITEAVTWTLEFFIPFALLEKYVGPLGEVAGQTWRGNFFKCAEENSHPHWAAWSPVDEFNFHRPHCFGELRFD